jgi:hypothetical protein
MTRFLRGHICFLLVLGVSCDVGTTVAGQRSGNVEGDLGGEWDADPRSDLTSRDVRDLAADVGLSDRDTPIAPDDGIGDDMTPPGVPPNLEQFDTVVDLARGSVSAWAYLYAVGHAQGEIRESVGLGYGDTADRNDFWPASTIKVYPVTAALMILKSEGFSLDSIATFYHESGGSWVRDIEISFRDMIFETFTCSSNSAYTLLLRFAGIDWINENLFRPEHGLEDTALMRGYVTDRTHVYQREERQRIVVSDGAKSFERIHEWSGTSYANVVGCTVYNQSGTANCSSPRNMVEHMRRVMLHEDLPDEERFDVRPEDLDWVRYGDAVPVMNNKDACGGPGWDGVSRVFPESEFYHKGGRVSDYRIDLQFVDDEVSGVQYVLAVATDTGGDGPVEKLSEEIARMMRTPRAYVHLDYLTDNVNPVTADLVVYSEFGGTLGLVTKDFETDGSNWIGWADLAGTSVAVPPGISAHTLNSTCASEDAKVYVRGLLQQEGEAPARSDLHYVVIDGDASCP